MLNQALDKILLTLYWVSSEPLPVRDYRKWVPVKLKYPFFSHFLSLLKLLNPSKEKWVQIRLRSVVSLTLSQCWLVQHYQPLIFLPLSTKIYDNLNKPTISYYSYYLLVLYQCYGERKTCTLQMNLLLVVNYIVIKTNIQVLVIILTDIVKYGTTLFHYKLLKFWFHVSLDINSNISVTC